MVGVIIYPGGVAEKSDIPVNMLYMMNSHEIQAGKKRYHLFYESTSSVRNDLASRIIGYSVNGPVIFVRYDKNQMVTPSREEILSLLKEEIDHRDQCTIL